MRVYVAGQTGLVGKAVCRAAGRYGHDVVTAPRVDLRDRAKVVDLFRRLGPIDAVVLAAARVGGIGANASDPVGFLLDNTRIATNVIEVAHLCGVGRLINLGSSCIYPRDCPQPIREEYLMTGPLEGTNAGYALAKISALYLTEFYRQAGAQYTSLMPTNLYGPGDTYNNDGSHVIPALILKFSQAVRLGLSEVVLWGTGSPLREFMHVDDLASAIMVVLGQFASVGWMNVGSGQEMSISTLADKVAKVVGFEGTVVWDTRRPDGTPRKRLDCSKIRALGWSPVVDFDVGLEEVVKEYRSTHG